MQRPLHYAPTEKEDIQQIRLFWVILCIAIALLLSLSKQNSGVYPSATKLSPKPSQLLKMRHMVPELKMSHLSWESIVLYFLRHSISVSLHILCKSFLTSLPWCFCTVSALLQIIALQIKNIIFMFCHRPFQLGNIFL